MIFSFCQQDVSALEVGQIFVGFWQYKVNISGWLLQLAYNNNMSFTTIAGFRGKKMLLLDLVAQILLSDKLILVPLYLEDFLPISEGRIWSDIYEVS